MIIRFAKCRPTAITPTRGHPTDAGLDLYYSPESMNTDESSVRLDPGQNYKFPTGIKVELPAGYAMIGLNRSGIALKRSLVLGAQCVDAFYSGEIFCDIHNIGNSVQVVTPGTKIAQLVMVPIITFRAMEIPEEELYANLDTTSARGDNALGSTGDHYIRE